MSWSCTKNCITPSKILWGCSPSRSNYQVHSSRIGRPIKRQGAVRRSAPCLLQGCLRVPTDISVCVLLRQTMLTSVLKSPVITRKAPETIVVVLIKESRWWQVDPILNTITQLKITAVSVASAVIRLSYIISHPSTPTSCSLRECLREPQLAVVL